MPLTRPEQRLRRRARARTLQALYAWEALPDGGLVRVANRLWDDLAVPADVRELAAPLLRSVHANAASIDALLTDITTNWRLERLGAVERAVLRLGVAELQLKSTPARV